MFRLPTTLNANGRRLTRDRLDGGSALHVCHRPYLLPARNYNPAVRGLAIDCREHRGLGLNALGLVRTHARAGPETPLLSFSNAEPAGRWEFHAESLAVDAFNSPSAGTKGRRWHEGRAAHFDLFDRGG